MELDRTDIAILRALQADARLSYRDLARRVGVSVPTISARVANLEDIGILAGYHADVDVERLRQLPVVLIAECHASKADAVGKALASMPEIRWTVRTRGSRILAEAVLLPSDSVDVLLDKIRRLNGVVSVESHAAVKRFKDAPRAILSEGVSATILCFECGKEIDGAAVTLTLDGRKHYLCCTSCERLYRERYARIKKGIKASPRAARSR